MLRRVITKFVDLKPILDTKPYITSVMGSMTADKLQALKLEPQNTTNPGNAVIPEIWFIQTAKTDTLKGHIKNYPTNYLILVPKDSPAYCQISFKNGPDFTKKIDLEVDDKQVVVELSKEIKTALGM